MTATTFEQALLAFDRARSWEESRAARDRILALGPEVLSGVVSEIAQPQPPDRLDLLLELLMRHQTFSETIEMARSADREPVLRASLASVLAHYVQSGQVTETSARRQICFALLDLAKDPDVGVRLTAVEALGLAELRETEVIDLLAELGEADPNDVVRAEARATLAELA